MDTILVNNLDSSMWNGQKKNLLKQVNQNLQEFKSITDQYSTGLEAFAHKLNTSVQSFISDPQTKVYSNYYAIFYYVVLGVSTFMLFLFLMYAFGLAGMCARRKHANYKQCCHRGTSANFLLASAGFYFLFTWIIIIVCIIFYVPGVTVRQFACKPAMELEQNTIFNVVKSQPEIKHFLNEKLQALSDVADIDISNINVAQLLIDCNLTNKSDQIKKIFKRKIEINLKQKTKDMALFDSVSLKNFIDNNLPNVKFTEEIQKTEKIITLLKPDGNLKEIQAISEKISRESENFKEFLTKELETELAHLRSVSDVFKSIFQNEAEIKSLNEKLSKLELTELINKNTNKLIQQTSNFAQSEIDKLVMVKADSLANELPSCKILHTVYENTILTVCLQYTDNFNTYWVTLLFLVLLHFIIACLALNQADLFRKSYPYEELLADTEPTEGYKEYSPNGDQYEIFRTKSNTNVPIDAYEMHGYTKNNSNAMAKTRATPPPNYKVTRA